VYENVSPETTDVLDHISRIIANDAHDPRVGQVIGDLKRTAANIMGSSQGLNNIQMRSSLHTVADGLLAAAEICSRLQDGRS
jgi:hypothetical protein